MMVKMPPVLAAHIGALPQRAAHRPPELLHLTLLPLPGVAVLGGPVAARVSAVLDALALPTFRLVFDRIHCRGGMASLRPSEPLVGALAFQRSLVAALARAGLPAPSRYSFHPHITLTYAGEPAGEAVIDPISWLVEDIRLIESIVGQTRHVEHGRWTLGGVDKAA